MQRNKLRKNALRICQSIGNSILMKIRCSLNKVLYVFNMYCVLFKLKNTNEIIELGDKMSTLTIKKRNATTDEKI